MSEPLKPDPPDDPGKSARELDAVRHVESTRRKLHLAGGFYAVLAHAAADGFLAFRDEVTAAQVESRGLPHSIALGLVKAHALVAQKTAQATCELLDPATRKKLLRDLDREMR